MRELNMIAAVWRDMPAAEERAKVVAYLQANADPIVRNWISAQIEAKEHLK